MRFVQWGDPLHRIVLKYAQSSYQLQFPFRSSAKCLVSFRAKQSAHTYPLEAINKPLQSPQEQDAKDTMAWQDISKEEKPILDIIVGHNWQRVDDSGSKCSIVLQIGVFD